MSSTGAAAPAADTDALRGTYALGIAMLVASLICTGVHGALQERTYNKYGPHWREGIFYTVRSTHGSTPRSSDHKGH
jgi:solute carrier family 35 (UDP-xylose/UDP-N-acetylglucosamine transporter), member B4